MSAVTTSPPIVPLRRSQRTRTAPQRYQPSMTPGSPEEMVEELKDQITQIGETIQYLTTCLEQLETMIQSTPAPSPTPTNSKKRKISKPKKPRKPRNSKKKQKPKSDDIGDEDEWSDSLSEHESDRDFIVEDDDGEDDYEPTETEEEEWEGDESE